MKKVLLILVVVIGVLFITAPTILGFSLLHIGHAVSVSTALTAKLACSGYFISGFSQQQIVQDLTSYSPVTKMVTLKYDHEALKVTSDLFGLAKTTARFRKGMGCALDGQYSETLNAVRFNDIKINNLKPWPVNDLETHEAPFIQDLLNQMVRSDNEKGYNTRAMLMIKGGRILAESYGPNITKNTPLLGWSMAKSATSIMLGHLEYLNKVNTNQVNLFPYWENDSRANISLENLLQMTSGLKFDETYAPGSDATHMLFTAHSASDVALQSPLANTPGSRFSYSSGTANLLSRYIHQTLGSNTQMSYHFLMQKIFTPLGMTNSTFEVDASGVFVGSSYLYASGRDWAKLGLLMLNKGKVNDQRLLTSAWVEKATTPNKSNNDKRYGYQFWLNTGQQEKRWPTLPEDAFAMMGNRKQSVMIIPSKNVVFVRLGWTSGHYPMEQNYNKLLTLVD